MMKKLIDTISLRCIDYVEIGTGTSMFTVSERRTVRGFLFDREVTAVKKYVSVRNGRCWLDERGEVVDHGSELEVKLCGVAVNQLAQRHIDQYVASH